MTDTNNNSHPCHGYDVALNHVLMKIEQRSNVSGQPFDDVLAFVLFHHDNELHKRLLHIADKYHHTIDEVVDRLTMLHESWEGDYFYDSKDVQTM